MENLVARVGKNLRTLRKSRGLSLDKLSELSGVSKAMLAQVERGESNPTITVLWKIANGLHISVTALIEEETPEVTLVRRSDVEPMTTEDGKYSAFQMFPYTESSRFEIYAVDMEPGCVYASEPHHEGVEEFVSVTEGRLVLQLGEERYEADCGDSIRFPADQGHIYLNETDSVVRIQCVILYPDRKSVV